MGLGQGSGKPGKPLWNQQFGAGRFANRPDSFSSRENQLISIHPLAGAPASGTFVRAMKPVAATSMITVALNVKDSLFRD